MSTTYLPALPSNPFHFSGGAFAQLSAITLSRSTVVPFRQRKLFAKADYAVVTVGSFEKRQGAKPSDFKPSSLQWAFRAADLVIVTADGWPESGTDAFEDLCRHQLDSRFQVIVHADVSKTGEWTRFAEKNTPNGKTTIWMSAEAPSARVS